MSAVSASTRGMPAFTSVASCRVESATAAPGFDARRFTARSAATSPGAVAASPPPATAFAAAPSASGVASSRKMPCRRSAWRTPFTSSASTVPRTVFPRASMPVYAKCAIAAQTSSCVAASTSSTVVQPSKTLRTPSSRSVSMPSSTAQRRMVGESEFFSTSVRTASVTRSSS